MVYVRIGIQEFGGFTVDENLAARTLDAVQAATKSAPGFLSYEVGYDGEGNIVTVSRWETEEQAAGPYDQMRAWLAENVGDGIRLIRNHTFDSRASIVA